jgi:hypothetical protein
MNSRVWCKKGNEEIKNAQPILLLVYLEFAELSATSLRSRRQHKASRA